MIGIVSKETFNSRQGSHSSARDPEWVTVAQNLIRHRDSKIYYLRSKCKGKQLKRSLGTTDRQLANRKLKIALADLAKKNPAILVVPASTTVQTLISHFFPIRIVGAKPKTAARTKNAYDAISKQFRNKQVRELSPKDIDDYANGRLSQISASSANKERSELIQLLDYAIDCGLVEINLAQPDRRFRVRGIKPFKDQPKEAACPTQQEFEAILSTIRSFNNIAPDGIYRPKGKLDPRSQKAGNLIEFLAYSGTRLNEAVSLLWKDVHFAADHPNIRIDGGQQGTKNGKIRTIPMFPKLKEFLLRILPDKIEPNEKVIGIGSAAKALKTACNKLDIGPYTHHSFRHYFVTESWKKGVDWKTLSEWVGHSDGGILLAKRYSHLTTDHSWEMAQRLI